MRSLFDPPKEPTTEENEEAATKPKRIRVTKTGLRRATKNSFLGKLTDEDNQILEAHLDNPGEILGLSPGKMKKLEDVSRVVLDMDEAQQLLFIAKEMILCHLPLKPHKDENGKPRTHYTRTIRTPEGVMTFSLSTAEEGKLLPYGTDRRTLLWLQTKAKQQNNPVIEWKTAKEFFDAFKLSSSGTDYKRLKESWDRIEGCSFHISFRGHENNTEMIPFIKSGRMPSMKDKRTESFGQESLMGYYVELSGDFFQLLQKSAVPIRLEVMREFQKEPKAWDLVQFICWRSFLCECAKANGKPSAAYISWADLQAMGASNDSNPKQLRYTQRKILERLKVVWPQCQAEILHGGTLKIDAPLDSIHPVRSVPQLDDADCLF